MANRVEHLAEGVTVYCGRCEDVLPEISGVRLIFTSPPYNLGNTSGGGFPGKKLGHYRADAGMKARGGLGKWSGGSLATGYGTCADNLPHAEYVAWQKDVLRLCWNTLADDGAIFYNHKPRIFDGRLVTPFAYNPDLPVRQVIVWSRAGGVNFSPAFYLPTHEWVVVFAKEAFRLRDKAASGAGDVWYIPQEGGTEHPAPFPVALPERAVETTRPGLILDPFMGSGTTGIAAVRHGRPFTGIELEPRWFDLARRRIADELRRPRLFAERPVAPVQEAMAL